MGVWGGGGDGDGGFRGIGSGREDVRLFLIWTWFANDTCCKKDQEGELEVGGSGLGWGVGGGLGEVKKSDAIVKSQKIRRGDR